MPASPHEKRKLTKKTNSPSYLTKQENNSSVIIKKKYWNVALLHWRDIKFINIMLILAIKKPTKKKKERKKKKKKSHYLFMASATLSRCI